MVCQLLNLKKVKCILPYFSHVVCQLFCCGQAVEVFFDLISGISRNMDENVQIS